MDCPGGFRIDSVLLILIQLYLVSLGLFWTGAAAHTQPVCVHADEREMRPAFCFWRFQGEPQSPRKGGLPLLKR